MSQDRMNQNTSGGVNSSSMYQAPDIDATLSKASQAMKKVRVVHGANQEYLELEGKTVGYVRKKMRDVLNLPGDAEALIAGKSVGDDFVLEGNMSLEFTKEAGQKGKTDLFVIFLV